MYPLAIWLAKFLKKILILKMEFCFEKLSRILVRISCMSMRISLLMEHIKNCCLVRKNNKKTNQKVASNIINKIKRIF